MYGMGLVWDMVFGPSRGHTRRVLRSQISVSNSNSKVYILNLRLVVEVEFTETYDHLKDSVLYYIIHRHCMQLEGRRSPVLYRFFSAEWWRGIFTLH